MRSWVKRTFINYHFLQPKDIYSGTFLSIVYKGVKGEKRKRVFRPPML